jgi:hypothetical protein
MRKADNIRLDSRNSNNACTPTDGAHSSDNAKIRLDPMCDKLWSFCDTPGKRCIDILLEKRCPEKLQFERFDTLRHRMTAIAGALVLGL